MNTNSDMGTLTNKNAVNNSLDKKDRCSVMYDLEYGPEGACMAYSEILREERRY